MNGLVLVTLRSTYTSDDYHYILLCLVVLYYSTTYIQYISCIPIYSDIDEYN